MRLSVRSSAIATLIYSPPVRLAAICVLFDPLSFSLCVRRELHCPSDRRSTESKYICRVLLARLSLPVQSIRQAEYIVRIDQSHRSFSFLIIAYSSSQHLIAARLFVGLSVHHFLEIILATVPLDIAYKLSISSLSLDLSR